MLQFDLGLSDLAGFKDEIVISSFQACSGLALGLPSRAGRAGPLG